MINPRISEDDAGLDDFLAQNVAMIHFEALDTAEWFATIQLDSGEVWQLHFGAKNPKARGYARAESLGTYPSQGRLN